MVNISEVVIDTDKNWNNKSINNVNEVQSYRLRLRDLDGNNKIFVYIGATSPNSNIHILPDFTKISGATAVPVYFGYNSDITNYSFMTKWSGSNQQRFYIDDNHVNVLTTGGLQVNGATVIDRTGKIYIGDDCWLVDVNIANAACLQGSSDPTTAKLYFGSNKDVDLYHGGTNILKTSNNLEVMGYCKVYGNITAETVIQQVIVAPIDGDYTHRQQISTKSGTVANTTYMQVDAMTIGTHMRSMIASLYITPNNTNHTIWAKFTLNDQLPSDVGAVGTSIYPMMAHKTFSNLNPGDTVKAWVAMQDAGTSGTWSEFASNYVITSETEPVTIL